MVPQLADGDEVLVDIRRSVREGDIVVARHPFRSDVHLVKRLVGFDESGRGILAGDNPSQSTDSRTLGAVRRDLILGPVTAKLP